MNRTIIKTDGATKAKNVLNFIIFPLGKTPAWCQGIGAALDAPQVLRQAKRIVKSPASPLIYCSTPASLAAVV